MIGKRTGADGKGHAPPESAGIGRSATQPLQEPSAEDSGGLNLRHVPTNDIRRELARRAQELPSLLRRRDRLREQLSALEAELAALHEPPPEAPPTRLGWEPFESLPVPEAIARVVSIGETISSQEVTHRLLDKRYGTRLKNLRARVAQALAGESRFRRVARGRYERGV